MKLAGCDGDSNAWYEDDTVTVCYEYIDEQMKNAPKETTPAGVTRVDAIVGPTVEVFLHEVGHAVFDYLKVPLFGREEDAADQFAAYILLRFGKSDARRLIGGVAYAYQTEASVPSTKKNPFADEHGLPAQRFYNVLCIAYGADPKLFADLVEKKYLPEERAEGCDGRVRADQTSDDDADLALYRSGARETGAGQAMAEVRSGVTMRCRRAGAAARRPLAAILVAYPARSSTVSCIRRSETNRYSPTRAILRTSGVPSLVNLYKPSSRFRPTRINPIAATPYPAISRSNTPNISTPGCCLVA